VKNTESILVTLCQRSITMSDYNYKPALDKPYITLVCNPYECESSVNTRLTIEVMEKDLTRDEMVGVLEEFLKAIGYTFDKGEHLGYERY